jgi:hypothetical protein
MAPSRGYAVESLAIAQATCTPCPAYIGNNPSQSQIAAALNTAAAKYGLPTTLLDAIAWQESKWHEDVTSCDGGVGLMQVQYYYQDYFNGLNVPECGLSSTSDNIYTLAGNADLGAKYVKYLECFWSYWGNVSGSSLSNPAQYTIAWYYEDNSSPPRQYPDLSSNPSLCSLVYQDARYPEYPAMTSSPTVWSCPFDPANCTPPSAPGGQWTFDNRLLDMTVSAYNQGIGSTVNYGPQNNAGYVSNVEYFITQFASGALPVSS